MMQYTKCPDCKSTLVAVYKIFETGQIGPSTLRICTNSKCAHFTNLKNIDTWTENKHTYVPPLDMPKLPTVTRIERY